MWKKILTFWTKNEFWSNWWKQMRSNDGRRMLWPCSIYPCAVTLVCDCFFPSNLCTRTLSRRHQRHTSMAIVCRLNTFIAIVIVARWACDQTFNATLNVLIFKCYELWSICTECWLNYNNCAMGFLLILCIANLEIEM